MTATWLWNGTASGSTDASLAANWAVVGGTPAGTLPGPGDLAVIADATVAVPGAMAFAGQVVNATGGVTLALDAGATIGAGAVLVAAPGGGGGDTLSIASTGTLGNAGTIYATGASLTLVPAGGLTNTGSIVVAAQTLAGGGRPVLEIDHGFANLGALFAQEAVIGFDAGGAQLGGVTALQGGTLRFQGSTPLVSGTVHLFGGVTATADGASVESGGLLQITGGQWTSGTTGLGGAGTLLVEAGATVDDVSSTIDGLATLSGDALWRTGTLGVDRGALAVAGGTVLVAGSLSLGVYPVDVAGGFPIGGVTPPGTHIPGGGGTLILSGGGRGRADGMVLRYGSSITLDGSAALAVGGGGFVPGAITVAPGATMEVKNGSIDGDLAVGGTLLADGDSWMSIGFATHPYIIYNDFPGTFALRGALSGNGVVDIAYPGTFEVGSAAAFAGTFALGVGTTLRIDTGLAPLARFTGFASGSETIRVDLHDVAWSAGLVPEYDGVQGTLAIGAATLRVGTGLPAGIFALAEDGSGGTLLQSAPGIACFAAGTRLATPDGPVAVEALRPGRRVLTAGGRVAPVVWVGHRRVACRRHARPLEVWPICVRAGAFGSGRPGRDLMLSPDHAVFVAGEGAGGGVLIPVRYLVNGASIARREVAQVTYWHVELDRHDVVLAEGLACESYLDTGNRGAFAGGGPAVALHPDFAMRAWEDACAELVLGGTRLAAARRRLLARAHALGFATDGDAGVRMRCGGAVLAPRLVAGGLHRFAVPAGVDRVALVSRSGVPAEMEVAAGDHRRLGAMVTRLVLRRPGWREEIALDGGALGAGFHAVEGHGRGAWRWTDGAGVIALPTGCARDGRLLLDVMVAAVQAGWAEGARPRVAAGRAAG